MILSAQVALLLLIAATQTDSVHSLDISVSASNSNSSRLESVREVVLAAIEKGTHRKCQYFPQHAREEFFNKHWSQSLSQTGIHDGEVMIYSPCMSSFNLGNSLGNYFNEISCARVSNVNLVFGTLLWEFPQMPYEYKGPDKIAGNGQKSFISAKELKKQSHNFEFFHALPTIFNNDSYGEMNNVTNSDNNTITDTVYNRVKKNCVCSKYCWSDSTAPWINNTVEIANIMNKALIAHISANNTKINNGTTIESHDLSSVPPKTFLPLVPDVAIHYRCGDTVPSKTYGFLPFQILETLIPMDSKYIYVLTDPIVRATVLAHNRFSKHCNPIMEELHKFLQAAFPFATVIVKKGGDPFLDYYRISKANVSICSVSTFCLWPALASTNTVYFPVTPLIADNKKPDFGPNFVWLNNSGLITEFQEDTILEKVLEILNKAM